MKPNKIDGAVLHQHVTQRPVSCQPSSCNLLAGLTFTPLFFWKLVSYSWRLFKFLLASGDTGSLLSSLIGEIKLLQ